MKLLYVWIEEFRNIHQQELIVDNEYKISICDPDGDLYGFYDSCGTRVFGTISNLFRKIFFRKLSFKKNDCYAGKEGNSPIQSVAALVGENASGKSTILECLHQRVDQSTYQNEENRYFLFVFLDAERQAIVVRTRDIWLLDAKDKKTDLKNNAGYEEYIFPLAESKEHLSPKSSETTKLLSIYQDHREETLYQSMMPSYEQERTALLETQKALAEAISASEQIYDDVEAFLPLVRQYTDLQELNARILNELIEKIVVHEKKRSDGGTVTQQVDIYYKFIGYIDPAAMLNEAISPSDSSGNTKPIAIIV